MSTAAAIYIGAYTIQMLIAHLDPEKEPEIINEFTAYTRIGENLDQTNLLTEDGMQLAAQALKEMHQIAEKEGVSEYRIAASGSLRNAVNRTQLFLICNSEYGILPQLLSTKDEARLHFVGTVTREFADLPIIVAYIGHYGVRIACGTMQKIDFAAEIPVGPGILNKKFGMDKKTFHFLSLRPIRNYLQEQFRDFTDQITQWRKKIGIAPELFLVGPFPTAYVSLALQMPMIDKNTIPSMPFPRRKLVEFSRKIIHMAPADKQKLPYLEKSMSENIASCAMIQRAIVASCQMDEFHVSPNGLCMGLLKAPASFTASVKV
jgi:exopolyphosphatase/guanosine-5'-triphosphate,3'-diphosphate pyrophosphatase